MRLGAVVVGVGAAGALLSAAAGGAGWSERSTPLGTLRASVTSVTAAAAPGGPVRYRPPVPAPIIDGFRPPSTPFGPGNRGVDYGTRPGQAVKAAAGGVVTFAGQVGGTLHVTIGHADGVRTSYSFLGSVTVRRGQRVGLGETIGTAGARPLHLGARRGTAYIDPRTLFTGEGFTVRLVPSRRNR